MKKIICALLAAIFVLAFAGCTGAGENGESTTLKGDEAASSTQPRPDKTVGNAQGEDDDIFFTEVLGEGEYTAFTQATLPYSYTVCKIKANVPGAAEFNSHIDATVAATAAAQLELIKNGEEPDYNVISVGIYQHEGLCTMLYRCEYSIFARDYEAYHFDSRSGEMLTDVELLNAIGTTHEEFLQKTNEAAREYLRDNPEGFSDIEKAIDDTRLYIGQNPVKPFVCDGNVCAAASVASAAGSDWAYRELTLTLAAASPAISVDEAMEKLGSSKAVKELMQAGMTMTAQNGVEKIAGSMCQLISLGTESTDSFVSEYLFGVSRECIFLYDATDDSWNYYN